MNIFTRQANKNIKATGNIWGVSTEYHFQFRVPLLFRWQARFQCKKSTNFMGRFGGGWNWQLGIMIGGTTIILNLLVMSIRFDRRKLTI